MTEKEINQRLMHASVVEAHLAACQQELAECKRIIEEAQKQEPVAWINQRGDYVEVSTKSTVYGSHTIPLYRAPIPAHKAQAVPVVPEGR